MNVAASSIKPLNIISLCTGGAGLDLGFKLAIPVARTVLMVERESFAVATLVAAMRRGFLDDCPIWSDARTLKGRPWRGLVDGVIGGIPCQPHSLAGKRLGAEDERDLWGDARRIIVQARPWFVLIENVDGMLSSGGAERVIRDLRRLGFTVEIGLFSATEVGASHQRNRVFILAVANRARMGFGGWPGPGAGVVRGRGRPDVDDARDKLANPGCGDQQRWRGSGELSSSAGPAEGARDQRQWHGHAAGDGSEVMADDCSLGSAPGISAPAGWNGIGTEPAIADYDRDALADAYRGQSPVALCVGGNAREDGARSAVERICWPMDDAAPRARIVHARQWRSDEGEIDARGASEVGLFPPGPSDIDGWRRVLAHSPHLEPAVCKLAHELDAGLYGALLDRTRIDQLRLLGNGVVPLQAAFAIRVLSSRLAAAGSEAAAFLSFLIEENVKNGQ